MTPALFSRVRPIAVPLLAVALLALSIAPVRADRRQVRNTTRTSLNSNSNRNVNVNQNRNVNVNQNRNVNVNVNHSYHGGGYYDHGPNVGAVVAASVATAIVVGAVVSSLPPHCNTVVVNGFAYQNCGGTYYQPQYQGSSVTYIVVNHP